MYYDLFDMIKKPRYTLFKLLKFLHYILLLVWDTLPCKLNSFMYCPFVSRNISLCSCMIFALPARIFDFFMYYPFMIQKTSLCSCLILAFAAWVFYSFMYCPLVYSNMCLLRKLFAALTARVFDSFCCSTRWFS